MTEAEFDEASRKALSLFEYGQVIPFLPKHFIVMSWLKFEGSEISFRTFIHQLMFLKIKISLNNVLEEGISVARKILRLAYFPLLEFC